MFYDPTNTNRIARIYEELYFCPRHPLMHAAFLTITRIGGWLVETMKKLLEDLFARLRHAGILCGSRGMEILIN